MDRADPWLSFARQDMAMAELALREGIWNQVCFHSQQCVEKALKAVLASRGCSPPRTHKLADLVRVLGDEVPADFGDDLRSLDRFYIPTRYPDALPGALTDGLPGEKDAMEALTLARRVMGLASRGCAPGR